MSPRPSNPDAGIASTARIDVTFGKFALSNFHVPYMAALLSMEQAATYLDLVTDDPTYARQDWKLNELYQREVNQFRVSEIAEKYLVEESPRPQFFNSLTVVVRAKDQLDENDYVPPSQEVDFPETLPVGPLRIDYVVGEEGIPKSGSFGSLKWNRQQVWATAIDGQHRLAAIREIWKQNRERLYGSHVSVIFIVIDEAVGFVAPEGWDSLRAMRSIFIDLNKRAIPVTRARNLLLDDLDPTAEFVRRLLGPSLQFRPAGPGDNEIEMEEGGAAAVNPDAGGEGGRVEPDLPTGEDGEFKYCLPLELVDWHGESKSKVESGPYVTSVLALDWIVRKTLKEKDLEVPERFDLEDVEDEEQYEEIRKTLQSWSHAWSEGIRGDWKRAKESQAPFYLKHAHIESLGEEFSKIWGPPITRLLTTLKPYAAVAKKRLDTLTPEFGQWYQARAARDNYSRTYLASHYEDELEKVRKELWRHDISVADFEGVVDTIEKDIKLKSIFFFLVAQRALMWAFVQLEKRSAAAEWADETGIELTRFERSLKDFYAYYLVHALNGLHRAEEVLETDFFRKTALTDRVKGTENLPREFWAGSLVKRDAPEQMDFSERAAYRGSKWLVFLAHLYWFMKTNEVSLKEMEENWDDQEWVESLKLGRELNRSIAGVLGASVEKNVYSHPMAYLVYGLEQEQRSMEVVKAAGKQRFERAIALCAKAIETG